MSCVYVSLRVDRYTLEQVNDIILFCNYNAAAWCLLIVLTKNS